MRVLVINHVTLDGVLQGPGRPDEDPHNGFRNGGWAQQAAEDPAITAARGERIGFLGPRHRPTVAELPATERRRASCGR